MFRALDYFLPNKKLHDSSFDQLAYETLAKIQILIFMLFSVLTLIGYAYHHAINFYTDITLHLVLYLGLMSFALCFLIKMTGNLRLSSSLFLLTILPVLCVRIFITGGVSSPLFSLLYLFPILTYIFNDKTFFKISTLLVAVIVIFFLVYPTPNPELTRLQTFAVDFLVLAAFSAVIYIYGEEKKRAFRVLTDIEKKSATSIVVSRFAHEINNTSSVTLMTLEREKQNMPETSYEKIKAPVTRTANIIRYITHLEENGVDTAAFLKKHHGETNILKIDSKI